MSISISKLVELDKTFKADQEAQLQTFVDVSKTIKLASNQIQQAAVNQFSHEKSLVESVIEAKGTTDKAPIAALESNSDYVKALENVNLLPADANLPAHSISYMNARQGEVDQFIEDKLNNE